MLEIDLILEPMLDNQKEINLRLLEEVQRMKKEVAALKSNGVKFTHAQHNQEDPADNLK